MRNLKIGLFCLCFFLCANFPAKAAEDVGPEAQKYMSIFLSQLTTHFITSVDQEFFSDKDNLYTLGKYLADDFPRSKARLAPDGSLKILLSFEDIKSTMKRFFDYDLPTLAPGDYDSFSFDGKDFWIMPADGAPSYWAQVKEAKELKTGNIAVKGVLRDPEEFEVATFTAELKPIVWKGMKTYAAISLKTTYKEE